jgi:hypothetical protein
MHETLSGIIALLDSSERLLLNGEKDAICAGLYTYAVEEYRKLLLLKEYVPSDERVEIDYKRLFCEHQFKFEVAIRNLPDECKILNAPVWEKGIWESGIWNEETVIADFEARLAIFCCGISDSHDDVAPVPTVDKDRLKIAINKLRTIALGIDIS